VGTTIVGSLALVDIFTCHAISGVTIFACTSVTAERVGACGIRAALVSLVTLVDVSATVGGFTFETGLAFAFPATDVVCANCVVTAVVFAGGTLVNVGTLDSTALITRLAFTIE